MRISITAKLILFVLILSLASTYLVGKYSFEKAKNALVNRTFDQLTSLRIEKTSRIQNLFLQCQKDISNISRSDDTKEILQLIAQSSNQSIDTLIIRETFSIYNKYLKGYFEASKYYSKIIFITDSKALLINIKENGHCSIEAPLNPILSELSILSKSKDSVIYKDKEGYGEKMEPIIFIALKIYSNQAMEDGSVILEVPIQVINDIMFEHSSYNGLGQTGETYLVGSDYLMRSTSRFQNNSVFKTKVSTDGVREAFAGVTGKKEIIDYREIPVLSSFGIVNIPGLNWAILAEIDTKEAMIPIVSIKNNIIYLTFIIFLLLSGVVALFTSMITAPIRSLISKTEKVANGEFGQTLNYKANDEVGDLVNSFNKMTLQLKSQSEKLEIERVLRLTSLIDGQELERRRLSKELHDGLGQLILAGKLKFERVLKGNFKNAKQIIGETEELFKKTMQEVRNISNGLMPAVLTEFGLQKAIRNLAKEISESSGINIIVDAQIQSEYINSKFETYLYRIIQEALNNVIKHAKATEVIIFMFEENGYLELSICDNGIGILTTDIQKGYGNGLNNMRDRAIIMGGEFKIRANRGRGTEVYVLIKNSIHGKN